MKNKGKDKNFLQLEMSNLTQMRIKMKIKTSLCLKCKNLSQLKNKDENKNILQMKIKRTLSDEKRKILNTTPFQLIAPQLISGFHYFHLKE